MGQPSITPAALGAASGLRRTAKPDEGHPKAAFMSAPEASVTAATDVVVPLGAVVAVRTSRPSSSADATRPAGDWALISVAKSVAEMVPSVTVSVVSPAAERTASVPTGKSYGPAFAAFSTAARAALMVAMRDGRQRNR